MQSRLLPDIFTYGRRLDTLSSSVAYTGRDRAIKIGLTILEEAIVRPLPAAGSGVGAMQNLLSQTPPSYRWALPQ